MKESCPLIAKYLTFQPHSGKASTPKAILGMAAAIDKLVRGAKAKLTADRVAYFCHPDWVVSPTHPAPDEWAPRIDTHEGLADTADWYRTEGWL